MSKSVATHVSHANRFSHLAGLCSRSKFIADTTLSENYADSAYGKLRGAQHVLLRRSPARHSAGGSEVSSVKSCNKKAVCITLVNAVKKAPVPPLEADSRYESFASTRWSIVLEAGDSTTTSAHALNALSELCEIYWRPLYAFLRKRGYSPQDAQDLTQGFFADLIETRAYARADRDKGRFRSFLLGTLKHFIADVRDRGQALKRGGGMLLQRLDDRTMAEAEAQVARAAKWEADEVYDREWAASLLRQALDRLTQECTLAGKAELLSHLMPYLSATEESAIPYEQMAQRTHRPVTTLRSDVARLRARYRALLREEVRGTVVQATEVDEELRHLCRALAAGLD
jgi:RNA polymerase sigma factor (sigma-70 family)